MESIWMKDYVEKNLPTVNKNLSTPILIIGGGLNGIMCAYMLMRNNIDFLLVEGRKLASGVSANTTAQLSVAHDNKYDEIRKKHGRKASLKYLQSQMEGFDLIKNIIHDENINCDFKIESTKLCADADNHLRVLESQYELIKEIKKDCNLLFSKKDVIDYEACIEFKDQAIFNPMKYMMAIVDILIKNQVPMYENSRVTKINKKDKYEVIINDKYTINTDKIIMACQYPFINPDNLYFSKIYQSSSYAVAFKTALKLEANYIFLDKPYYYLRTYDDSTLIIGGNDHFTGSNSDIEECYQDLILKIKELDKNAEITHQWFTEDCMPIDSLPLIGKYSRKHPNIILVTGFQKWGFTNSHMAAVRVKNMLLKQEYDKLYNPMRWILFKSFISTFRMVGQSVNGLVLSKLFTRKHELSDIGIDSGKVTKLKNKNVLVYRKSKNEYIILRNKCTHMGCSLIWNDVDKVWISKCHGSIFDKYGKVIHGPALADLEQLDFPFT